MLPGGPQPPGNIPACPHTPDAWTMRKCLRGHNRPTSRFRTPRCRDPGAVRPCRTATPITVTHLPTIPMAGRPMQRSISAPIIAACWWPRPARDGFRVARQLQPHRPPGRGPARDRQAVGGGDGARHDGAACLCRTARAPADARCARDRHRGLPARRQRAAVPRPGEGRDRHRLRHHHPARGSRTGARQLRARCYRAGRAGRCCSISAAAPPNSAGSAWTRPAGRI